MDTVMNAVTNDHQSLVEILAYDQLWVRFSVQLIEDFLQYKTVRVIFFFTVCIFS